MTNINFKNSLLTDDQRNRLAGLLGGGGTGTVNAYSEVITGDGISLAFTINHNLDSLEVISATYDYDNNQVMTDVKILDNNNIAVIFNNPPLVSETYTVVVV